MLASQYILSGLILIIFIGTIKASLTKKMPKMFTFTWLAIWISGFTMVVHPSFLSSVASFLKIGRGVDVAVYFSIILLFFFIYKIFVKIDELEKMITKIVRNWAIKDKE